MKLKRLSYRSHLQTSEDLVTTYEARRAGFVALALEKNRLATPFVEQARALKAAAARADSPEGLLLLEDIRPALLTAAGLSDKALTHLQVEDKTRAIRELIQNFLLPAGANWVEELVYRFLLTRGDTLGGAMRNVGGVLAQRKLTREIIAALTITGRSYHWFSVTSRSWIAMSDDDVDIALQLRGLSWQTKTRPRSLLFNLSVPVVRNNIDLCLLDCAHTDLAGSKAAKLFYQRPEIYLALGELKGGIDPAGADEHWKTARTALNRIQAAFAAMQQKPLTFFIGAAIERKMAGEIWQSLQEETLSNAANLTDVEQVASISQWLCNL